jgi:hypothetical protein
VNCLAVNGLRLNFSVLKYPAFNFFVKIFAANSICGNFFSSEIFAVNLLCGALFLNFAAGNCLPFCRELPCGETTYGEFAVSLW